MKRPGQKPKRGEGPRDRQPRPESGRKPFAIAGIGASAGGLEAFTRLLNHLPVDTGMAFVLVQHLDPAHESALTGLLRRATTMPVSEVTNNLRVERNRVYVIPPNTNMAVAGGKLNLSAHGRNRGAHRAIDFFLESLAREQREHAIGVILSGTATDGTLGLEAIKAEGGITFAQDESAKYDSMPRSAVAAGCVDFVLSPENIAKELARIASHPLLASQPPLTAEAEGQPAMHTEDRAAARPSGGRGAARKGAREARAEESQAGPEAEGIKEVLSLLRQHSRVDFSLYKPNTIQRRVTRRMVLSKQNTLRDYARFLRGNEKELDALYSDVLISVTSFFRDPGAFDVLQRKVFPRLVAQRKPDEPLRVWVAGCSTGQEAYSIAMAFTEYADKLPRPPKLQVFATDLNDALLEKARDALYTKTLTQDVSPARLRRFFVEEETGYRVCRALREMVVFARQNLISDPPFSRIDLISCRNILIYLEAGLQKKILPSLHYALRPGGFLFLGASETIGSFGDLFEPVDKKHKIFARKTVSTPAWRLPLSKPGEGSPLSQASRPLGAPIARVQNVPEGMRDELSAQREVDRLLAGKFAPPGVLINAEMQILQFRGALAAFLQLPKGRASLDVLKMAREELMLPLRAAINKAKKENAPVRREDIRVTQNGQARSVHVEVIPLKNLKERCFLILFESRKGQEASHPVAQPPAPKLLPKREEARRISALERELAETRDYLQSLHEQYEAANEELQASSEETQSTNEELQSVNEELETSKEELESSNEELITVNEEMGTRNTELGRVNADLKNLHVSINTAILVLGRDLTIRHFTPMAQKQFNLLASDAGRPLSGVRHRLAFPGLESFIAESISTVSPREREVQDEAGKWYSLRVRPYVTADNKIDGAVLVLVNITELKQKEQKIQEARQFAQAIINEVPPLLILKPDLRVQSANKAFYRSFHVIASETENCLLYDLGNGQWNIPALRKLLEEILPRQGPVEDYEVTHKFERIGERTMLLNARQIETMQLILLSIVDITERKKAELALDRVREELEKTVQARTVSLRETVQELEAFSYSMVHDMRAPLRAMNTFAHLVHENYGSQLDEQGREYLARIFSSAERLDQLIRDVLNYSRTLRDQAPLSPVNLDELIPELLATYPDWRSRQSEVKIEGPLGVVIGHKALLAQCFSNLVGNALKFVAPEVKPHVRIWAESRDHRVRINIQDNGIGIAVEHHKRVFGMFQRIHPASDYVGTGIGLAIVRRAVERMHGQAGFQSEVGKGSTFWFELPKGDDK